MLFQILDIVLDIIIIEYIIFNIDSDNIIFNIKNIIISILLFNNYIDFLI